MATPKISVIVPIYNVENYLEEALASLRVQTLEDIEIIAVNDGSTDSSREILQRCAELDPRIVIIDKENGGLSSARNAAIDAARSPYVCLLDSDDLYEPDACERIVRAFEEGGERTDVVTFGARCFPEEAADPWVVEHLSPRDISYEGFTPALFQEMALSFAARTACRTSFLRDNRIRFDENVPFGEDQAFHFAIYPRARKTVLISDKIYLYRIQREGSLMATVASNPERMMAEHIVIMNAIFADWQQAGFLDAYASTLVADYVNFALYGVLGLSDAKREELHAVGAKVLRDHLTVLQLEKLELPPATRNIVDAFLSDSPITRGKATRLRVAYHKQQYGSRSLFRALLRHGLMLIPPLREIGKRIQA